MEGTEKPHMNKYTEVRNDWNYDATCKVISLLVSDSENFKHLRFVAQCVYDNIQQNHWKRALQL